MTNSRGPANPHTLSFEATVEEVVEVGDRDPFERGGNGVVLSETYFYPEGGGQPPDRGAIESIDVLDVQERDGRIVHELAAPIERGTRVTAQIDPEFRRYCMCAHSASHALYGAARRLFHDLGYGGFDISEEKVRVDLSTESDVTDDDLVELERLTNRVVWEDRDVTWQQLPRDEALSRPEIAFNTKTEEGIEGDTVRVVTIDDWDVAACGGTHVSSTRQIGPVTVFERSNPGEGLTRVEFAVGETGLEHRAREKRAAYETANELGTGVGDLAETAANLRARRTDLESELADLERRLAAERVADLPTVEHDGAVWRVGEVDLDPDGLKDAAREHRNGVDIVALVGSDGSVAVAADGDSAAAADAVVETVTAEFGGGGGGSAEVAQAGGLDADPDEIVSFLRGGK